jgi:hypothetical protein
MVFALGVVGLGGRWQTEPEILILLDVAFDDPGNER